MTPKEYNQIKDPNTALAVRLAVTMGWHTHEHNGVVCVFQPDGTIGEVGKEFNPFADASIPYGLIGRGVESVRRHGGSWIATPHLWHDAGQTYLKHEDKTTAILMGYCQADPMGNWAKFIGEMK